MKKLAYCAVVCCFGLLFLGSGLKKDVFITGKTMGTVYHITVVTGYLSGTGDIEQQIARRLEAVNRSMSTYRPDSEISRFNAIDNTEKPFCASPDFASVLSVAGDLYRISGGAWDGTVAPLVKLWGFGGSSGTPSVPAREEIDRIKSAVGFDKIDITDAGCLAKRRPDVTLDLGSIAKGYGVDAVAALIRKAGFENFLVEIGGEVAARGVRRDGKPWRVGINTPSADAAFNSVYMALDLHNRAMATSGSYRHFFEIDGRVFSHVLDPRTGRPVQNGVVSASILAPDCTLADGLATAVMVLGPEKGLSLVEGLKGVEGMVIVRDAEGRLSDHFSSGFPRR